MRDLKLATNACTGPIGYASGKKQSHKPRKKYHMGAFYHALMVLGLMLFIVFSVMINGWVGPAFAAQAKHSAYGKADFYRAHLPHSKNIIDHGQWTRLLEKYVKTDNTGLNRVNYGAFKADQHQLKNYIRELAKVEIVKYNRKEQFAYWVNLYNALTINVVLDAYPVKTIRDIDISPGFFSNGPWGKKLIKIMGVDVSLDDIEHKILRPTYKDPRIHYAVNCASIGCPNLERSAYSGANLEQQLEAAARNFINSPRGVRIQNGRLIVSKIYSWFQKDFGNSEARVMKHLRQYANRELKVKLSKLTDISDFNYDWSLNDVNQRRP